ncbi:bifunctional 2-polyprenyl-6-hydroxyphenol methylase/3-demethylubiquinol 3-O-methyltransferase UbiG [Maridesulfovibrio ferrireducens]|uniref:class I SAM-dependent methyltransferase n=1 Tax=Maridesulfovibrio ferrireducens TaxID=246191 RepID=UPI001A1F6948|nr:class I SAM-dependent methyltransferase [Maridesulfovibrio ferrireducens]MBI9112690.1 class I SAM-dependent methyltransferase [Maridesulfovibrio ferrireducens]
MKKWQGLIYPDINLIRFFYKNRLHTEKGNVLEIGCGHGNNLRLFAENGWNVTGTDICSNSIAAAKSNFEQFDVNSLFIEGLLAEISTKLENKYDSVILPNVINYMSIKEIKDTFDFVSKVLKKDGFFFLITRHTSDFRCGFGDQIGKNQWKLNSDTTGEKGTSQLFFEEWEIKDLVQKHIKLKEESLIILRRTFDEIQKEMKIFNADTIIYGKKL